MTDRASFDPDDLLTTADLAKQIAAAEQIWAQITASNTGPVGRPQGAAGSGDAVQRPAGVADRGPGQRRRPRPPPPRRPRSSSGCCRDGSTVPGRSCASGRSRPTPRAAPAARCSRCSTRWGRGGRGGRPARRPVLPHRPARARRRRGPRPDGSSARAHREPGRRPEGRRPTPPPRSCARRPPSTPSSRPSRPSSPSCRSPTPPTSPRPARSRPTWSGIQTPEAKAAYAKLAKVLGSALVTAGVGKPCSTASGAYPNGMFPTAALCPLWQAPGEMLSPRAAAAFNAMTPGLRQADRQPDLRHRLLPLAQPAVRHQGQARAVRRPSRDQPPRPRHGAGPVRWHQQLRLPRPPLDEAERPALRLVPPELGRSGGATPEPWHWEYRTG